MNLDAHGLRVTAWICIAVLSVAAVIAVWRGYWGNVAILGGFAIGTALFLASERLPSLFALLFVLAAFINAASWALGLWSLFPVYDNLVHAYTTFAGTITAGYLAYRSKTVRFNSIGWLFILSISTFGIGFGVFWEFFEWAAGMNSTYRDVMMDLLMDSLGAAVAAVLSGYAVRRQKDSLARRQA
jgi:hypothetical protein